MMSTKSRNFRRRCGDDEDDSSYRPSSVTPNPERQKLLSFADDEHLVDALPAPSSRVSKSSSRSLHKMTSKKDRCYTANNVLPQTGQYSKKALLDLQRNTKTLPPLPSERTPPTLEPVVGDELDGDEESERERMDDRSSLGLTLMGICQEIPDQATTYVIKSKIDHVWKICPADPDFNATLLGGVGEAKPLAVVNEEEEERNWEEQQFKRATVVGFRVLQPFQRQSFCGAVGRPSNGGAMASQVMPIPQRADVAKKALQHNLLRLRESHTKTLRALNQMDENLDASLTSITALEQSLFAAGVHFIFMQKLSDFVSVVCDFLQYNALYIEELEDQMQQLDKELASAVSGRRTAANNDEIIEAEAAVSAAMSVFNKGGFDSATTKAATAAVKAAIDALGRGRASGSMKAKPLSLLIA